MLHLSPSNDQQCGIALFASVLNPHFRDSVLVSALDAVADINSDIVIEHEYGLNERINWNRVRRIVGTKIVIQHAFSPDDRFREQNETIMEVADKVVMLTSQARVSACTCFPDKMDKISVISHYSENLIDNIKIDIPDDYVVGIHGFAFPRNGFMKLLNSHNGKTRIYIAATISSFNHTAERETNVYMDKIRRKIWEINDTAGKEIVQISMQYYDKKEDISKDLRDNCDILTHISWQPPGYFNASGSINVLLSSGLPTFVHPSSATIDIPKSVVNRISNPSEIFNRKLWNLTATADGIQQYIAENAPVEFARKVLALLC